MNHLLSESSTFFCESSPSSKRTTHVILFLRTSLELLSILKICGTRMRALCIQCMCMHLKMLGTKLLGRFILPCGFTSITRASRANRQIDAMHDHPSISFNKIYSSFKFGLPVVAVLARYSRVCGSITREGKFEFRQNSRTACSRLRRETKSSYIPLANVFHRLL